MATVECKDCHQPVSITAEVCPHCGGKHPASHIKSRVTFHRNPGFWGMISSMLIMIDGKVVGELDQDDHLLADLSYGEHSIKAKSKIPGTFSGETIVKISPPQSYKMELSITYGLLLYQVKFKFILE